MVNIQVVNHESLSLSLTLAIIRSFQLVEARGLPVRYNRQNDHLPIDEIRCEISNMELIARN